MLRTVRLFFGFLSLFFISLIFPNPTKADPTSPTICALPTVHIKCGKEQTIKSSDDTEENSGEGSTEAEAKTNCAINLGAELGEDIADCNDCPVANACVMIGLDPGATDQATIEFKNCRQTGHLQPPKWECDCRPKKAGSRFKIKCTDCPGNGGGTLSRTCEGSSVCAMCNRSSATEVSVLP